MKYLKILIAIFSIITFCSCSSNKYSEGTFCADVTYYNPNTGTENTYQLNIEVEEGQLIKIRWPNGGWLDGDHYSTVIIDESGYASFTSSEGNKYKIQITGSECSYTDAARVQTDKNEEEEKSTCPECGSEKERYDDMCDDCERKKRDKTCKVCGEYNSFMFSTDEMCDDCEGKKRDKEEEEEERKRQEEEAEQNKQDNEDE